jgi:hypothetical protein
MLLRLAFRKKLTAKMSIATINIITGNRAFVGVEVGMLVAV